ncbi:MAG: 5'-methylthioadenosine/adenosylhomocysteine nucleosidase [Clostridia bacterium]|nr:5'-methylthioadenosine/adenosylhomocysteine nucleosidase [Clostridia bacterium]
MIGIIGAMDIEVDILKGLLEDARTEKISNIEFVSGKLFGRHAVVAKCGIGKVFAATCTEAMILKYSPELIINTGVAGSLSGKLSTLDVAIAKAVVQHDFDTSALGDRKGQVSGLDSVEIHADPAIGLALEGIVKGMGLGCEYGIIASGDRFICSAEEKRALAKGFSAVACEMEGGAIGHVCTVNKVPFAVIRAISDSADGNSTMDYSTFSEKAAKISAKIVENFIMSL